jgi:hypothetical protein
MPIATAEYELPNHTQCSKCLRWAETDNHFVGNICINCAEAMGYSQCDNCGEYHLYLYDYDDGKVCRECAENQLDLIYCDGCDRFYDNSEVFDCDNHSYCTECMENRGWVFCHQCNEPTRDASEGANGYDYCPSCWDELFASCDNCGCVCWRDDIYYTDYNSYCADCFPNNREEYDCLDFDSTCNTFNKIDERCFGVEIETDHCENHVDYRNIGCFGAKPDGSIQGMEFVSPIMSGDNGLSEIDKICRFAENNDWGVDRNCGLHVHFDMRNESLDGLKAITYALLSTYDVWSQFVAESRLENSYCGPSQIDLAEVFGITDFRLWIQGRRRYEWLNFRAYACHETFEIRLHQGSISAKEIGNWIRGLSLFIRWASRAGWCEVRNKLLCKDTSGRYDVIKGVWRDYGCEDLIEWFDSLCCCTQ